MVGLVLFVLSLRSRGLYLYQFGQFAWTHMIIVTILMQSSCFVANVLEGMIWFVFPVSIVFFNDAAYMASSLAEPRLSRYPLKKTWEGFIGGLIVTLIVAPFAAAWMQKYEWLICPVDDKSPLRLFGGASGCDVDLCLSQRRLQWGPSLVDSNPRSVGWYRTDGSRRWRGPCSGLETMRVSWFQVHAVVFASFASIIAPFGGFFASGFKRAFKIKDFSDTIPGHGGITDRMDCQMVMALFSHLYITNFIRQPGLMTVGQLLLKIEFLTNENLLRLYKAVGKMIVTKRPETSMTRDRDQSFFVVFGAKRRLYQHLRTEDSTKIMFYGGYQNKESSSDENPAKSSWPRGVSSDDTELSLSCATRFCPLLFTIKLEEAFSASNTHHSLHRTNDHATNLHLLNASATPATPSVSYASHALQSPS